MSFSSNRQQPSRAITTGSDDSRFLAALYLFEATAVVAVLTVHRYYNLLGTLTARQLAILVAPVAVCAVSGTYALAGIRRGVRSSPRRLAFALGMNLLAGMFAFASVEVVVRALAVQTPYGAMVGSTVLLPKRWDDVRARLIEIVAHAPADQSYFVADDLLGWVPGPSRQSSDRLYSSSTEGARSANPGAVLASLPAERRVVIVGDSFTFGLEVPFESAWGTVLERRLGDVVRVVNLGVDGYGVDQAVLRYERDGRPWKPDVAILGFIEHDLIRTLSVYSFVTFPEWSFPFAKPRFALRDGALEQLTNRLQPPREILAAPSLSSLPLIDHDPGYRREEWEQRSYHASYALRFLLSVFHRWPATDFTSDVDAIVPLNTALIARFVETARHDDVVPIVVFLPARTDFVEGPRPLREAMLAALASAGVSYLDLRSCIAAAGESNAFIPSRPHYSAAGNAAVAQCLLPDVRNALSRN